MSSKKYRYPVHIRFQPAILSDNDTEIISDFLKSHFGACAIAKEVEPIRGKAFLHGGGLSSKKVGDISTELHLRLGFMKDCTQMTYHRDWVRTVDNSRTRPTSGRAPSSGALQCTMYTDDIYKQATWERYWSTCKTIVYQHKVLSEDMMVKMDRSYSRTEKEFWLDVWYRCMRESGLCRDPEDLQIPEQLIWNYNLLCKESRILPVPEQKQKYHLATFWQVVCNKDAATLKRLGKELIPTTKQLNAFRDDLFEARKRKFQADAYDKAKLMYPIDENTMGKEEQMIQEALQRLEANVIFKGKMDIRVFEFDKEGPMHACKKRMLNDYHVGCEEADE